MNQPERMKIAARGERVGVRKLKEWGFKIITKGRDAYPHDVTATLNNESYCVNVKYATKLYGVQRSAIKNLVNATGRGALLFVDPDDKCTFFEHTLTDGFPLELHHYEHAKVLSFQIESHTVAAMLSGFRKKGYIDVAEYLRDALRTKLREDGLL